MDEHRGGVVLLANCKAFGEFACRSLSGELVAYIDRIRIHKYIGDRIVSTLLGEMYFLYCRTIQYCD